MFKELVASFIIAFWNAIKGVNPPKLFIGLFAEDKQLGDKMEYVPGVGGKKVMLAPSAYDAAAYVLPIDESNAKDASMLLFRSKKRVTERLKRDYRLAMASKIPNQIESVKKKILNEMADLIEGAEIVADIMAGQVLSTGAVTIAMNGVNMGFDYGLDALQKETLLTTAKWSDLSNSTPIADIIRWCDVIVQLPASGGERPTRGIMRTKTFNYMKNNVALRAAMALTTTFKDITPQMVIDYVQAQTGVRFRVYDVAHKDHTGVTTQYVFPEEIVTLLPAGEVGRMVYGVTPEEDEMMKPGKDIQVCGNVNQIAVKVKEVDDEVENTEVKASVLVLPSGENLGKIFIATVHS